MAEKRLLEFDISKLADTPPSATAWAHSMERFSSRRARKALQRTGLSDTENWATEKEGRKKLICEEEVLPTSKFSSLGGKWSFLESA
jgi:hypothetical protein